MSTTTHHSRLNARPARPTLATQAASAAHFLGQTLRLWRARHRERRAFPVLDDRDLLDMRLSRWDVERELAKPFWRG